MVSLPIVLYCLVLSCIVLSCLVLYCLVLYCLVLSCIVLSCLVLSGIVSFRIVSYRIDVTVLYLWLRIFSFFASFATVLGRSAYRFTPKKILRLWWLFNLICLRHFQDIYKFHFEAYVVDLILQHCSRYIFIYTVEFFYVPEHSTLLIVPYFNYVTNQNLEYALGFSCCSFLEFIWVSRFKAFSRIILHARLDRSHISEIWS